ncbi:hypothetical protein UFOVP422_20 [uncultured Caudovirales phage]|uniref:Gp6 domain containing protein n=1 Tax=uncultured Caudovirales phage TaxID=2100421 RepID=A0A6J5M9Y4_9CAUD|nr:hypothetical protein UFOVP422_20 [uncultured Caudovirales phage]
MALTTAAKIRATWLNIGDNTQDTRLGVLIAQAEAVMKSICKQPLASESVAYEFSGDGLQTRILPYTVPVVLSSLQYKAAPTDATWTTATGAIVVKSEGVNQLYLENGMTRGYLWRMNATVGYDGTTFAIPKDLETTCEEITVELFKSTDFSGRENRFGIATLSTTEGGQVQTTKYVSLMDSFRGKLSPYIVRFW